MAVRVWLLGDFLVMVGHRSIGEEQWRLKKAASLIKLLALAPGHQLHREQAMELLWPELGPEAAANNLHQALHITRRTLEPSAPPGAASGYLHLRGNGSPYARMGRCSWMSKPSKNQRREHATPWSRRPTGRP